MDRTEALGIVVTAVAAKRPPEEASTESKRRLYQTLASHFMFGGDLPRERLGGYLSELRTIVANTIDELIQPGGGLAGFSFDVNPLKEFLAEKRLNAALSGYKPGNNSKKRKGKNKGEWA